MPNDFTRALRPTSTSPEEIFTNNNGQETVVINCIFIVNLVSASRNYSIYLDPIGATWAEETAIAFSTAISGNSLVIIECAGGIPLVNKEGTIAVQTSNANSLNFTIYGETLDGT